MLTLKIKLIVTDGSIMTLRRNTTDIPTAISSIIDVNHSLLPRLRIIDIEQNKLKPGFVVENK